jgi:hypothetical protein
VMPSWQLQSVRPHPSLLLDMCRVQRCGPLSYFDDCRHLPRRLVRGLKDQQGHRLYWGGTHKFSLACFGSSSSSLLFILPLVDVDDLDSGAFVVFDLRGPLAFFLSRCIAASAALSECSVPLRSSLVMFAVSGRVLFMSVSTEPGLPDQLLRLRAWRSFTYFMKLTAHLSRSLAHKAAMTPLAFSHSSSLTHSVNFLKLDEPDYQLAQ